MTREDLMRYIEHPEALDKLSLPELERLVREYPYFQTAALLYLKNLKNVDDLNYQYELKRTALLVADRTRLESVMESEATAVPVETEVVKPVAAEVAIDTVEVASAALGEIQIPDDTANADAPKLQHSDLIDRFISENPHIKPVGEVVPQSVESAPAEAENITESIFTESLAKIYIKQKQYAKAIRIFEKLNLKYPEKSSYFADQINFLKKLTENS